MYCSVVTSVCSNVPHVSNMDSFYQLISNSDKLLIVLNFYVVHLVTT